MYHNSYQDGSIVNFAQCVRGCWANLFQHLRVTTTENILPGFQGRSSRHNILKTKEKKFTCNSDKDLPSSGFFTNFTPSSSNLLQALLTSGTAIPMCPVQQDKKKFTVSVAGCSRKQSAQHFTFCKKFTCCSSHKIQKNIASRKRSTQDINIIQLQKVVFLIMSFKIGTLEFKQIILFR